MQSRFGKAFGVSSCIAWGWRRDQAVSVSLEPDGAAVASKVRSQTHTS